nr:DUF1223 domain-containing protein [Hyphomonas sp. Mor2]
MMRIFALFVLAVSIIGSATAEADRPVLVELFANQNCPACPKAHRTMAQMSADRDDIFVLTWTVNYWDYLGEPDPMALPIAKDRQMAYTDRLSLRAPYTPQSFYDGAKECPGTRKRDIRRNISSRLKSRDDASPTLAWDGAAVSVVGESAEALELTVVEYLTGEANQTGMVNPVTKSESLGLWTGKGEAFPVSCEHSCAVLLQEQDVGEIVAVLPLH